MKLLKIAALSCLFIFSGNILAMSSQVPINGGGILNAKQTMDISFLHSGLISNVKYNVKCTIDNPNQENVMMHFNLILNYTTVAFSGQVDDVSLSSSYNSDIKPGKHTYSAKNFYPLDEHTQIATLQFINLDFTNQVTISDCYATPAL